LVERLRAKAIAEGARPESWVFSQKRDPSNPLWDSGVRDALQQTAQAEGCDFPGLGPHPSAAPTSPGGNKSAAAPSKPPRSPATAASRWRVSTRSSRRSGRTSWRGES